MSWWVDAIYWVFFELNVCCRLSRRHNLKKGKNNYLIKRKKRRGMPHNAKFRNQQGKKIKFILVLWTFLWKCLKAPSCSEGSSLRLKHIDSIVTNKWHSKKRIWYINLFCYAIFIFEHCLIEMICFKMLFLFLFYLFIGWLQLFCVILSFNTHFCIILIVLIMKNVNSFLMSPFFLFSFCYKYYYGKTKNNHV